MSLEKIIIVVFAYVAVSFAAWDGTTTSEPPTKNIDGRRYYAIGSPEELAWFASKVNSGDTAVSAVLVADIDLNSKVWNPIGEDTVTAFDGIFDGNGHRISGINVSEKMYAGLFGVIDVGTVKNLVIENSKIKGYYGVYYNGYRSYAGGVAGYTMYRSLIQNVINRATVASITNSVSSRYSNYSYMGGIVGYAYGKIIGCANEADLSSSSQYVGGIAGLAYYGGDSLKNTGVITCSDCEYVGGIVGYGGFYDNTVRNSINKGLVKGVGRVVGGICGYCYVDSSQNQGNIEIQGNKVAVGGISGHGGNTRLSLNYGNISAIADSALVVGGITGSGSVSYSGNFGKITGTTMSKTGKAYVGGVVGFGIGDGLSNVFNQGRLYSSHYAAGITSELPQDSITIKSFYVATDTIDAPDAVDSDFAKRLFGWQFDKKFAFHR